MPDKELARFDDFVSSRLPALYRYACALTGNRHDAEDLVQEALTRTGAGWRRVRRKDDPEGYVRVTMVRLVINRRRRNREQLMADLPDRATDDQQLDGVTALAAAQAALAGLPRGMRAVLMLRYVDGLSDEQIASVLGCGASTVRSQASRALSKLRAAADTQEESHG
ncbi:SigE family RNA polymerase sigma factor [Actinomadura sp. 9N215]|uniref:SigE family RNA polymerase sigma factor n=1 Tax=Actinomadura sp. 9N215 TaxID=3375150 RepID=UPI0037AA9522